MEYLKLKQNHRKVNCYFRGIDDNRPLQSGSPNLPIPFRRFREERVNIWRTKLMRIRILTIRTSLLLLVDVGTLRHGTFH